MIKSKKIILILIILLAAILRLWRLGEYPALNADEAAVGYNAHSLIQTSADEHGNPWPVHFQSFNDYKPGLTFYLVLPFVKIFGLSVWSVRILPALLGVATVYVLYLLIKELEIGKRDSFGVWKLEILASALLAISPWHIHFSRGAWEVNVATFFITLGVLLFLKSLKNSKLLVLSFLFFALSLYTYHSARVVAPLLVVGMVFIYRKQVKDNLKGFLIAGLVGLVILIPLGADLLKGSVFSRAAGVGLFADPGPITRIDEQRGEHQDFQGLIPQVLHNKAINFTLAYLENWLEHFWGEFLFLSGDEIQRNRVPETGQMYMFDFAWIVIGGWWMVKGIKKNKGLQSVVLWLFVAPVAAALTFQSPHALRAHNMAIPLVMIAAFGLWRVLRLLKQSNKPILHTTYYIVLLLVAWGFARHQLMYWKHMTKEYPFSSQYGLQELVNYIETNAKPDQKVLVTDTYDQPYILFLFYLKYSPKTFQKEHVLSVPDKYGFSTVREFGNFEFRSIDWEEDKLTYPGSLIIGTDDEIPDTANVIKEIYGMNGYKYFKIVAINY